MNEGEKPVDVQIIELIARIQANDLNMIAAEKRKDQAESIRISKETRVLAAQLAELKGENINRKMPEEATYDP